MSIQPSTVPAPCYRCTDRDMAGAGPIDGLCYACRGEVQANRDDARDELTVTVFTAHTAALHNYPADIRFPGGAA